MEHFVVKHYHGDPHPTIKGNGFDGLVVGDCRDETDEFVSYINTVIDRAARPVESAPTSTNSAMVPCEHCGNFYERVLWNSYWKYCPWCGSILPARHQ